MAKVSFCPEWMVLAPLMSSGRVVYEEKQKPVIPITPHQLPTSALNEMAQTLKAVAIAPPKDLSPLPLSTKLDNRTQAPLGEPPTPTVTDIVH